jgi:hypothetical protein
MAEGSRWSRTVGWSGDEYMLVRRNAPGGYTVVRMHDQLEVGAFWISRGDAVFLRTESGEQFARDNIRQIALSAIQDGLVPWRMRARWSRRRLGSIRQLTRPPRMAG